MLRIIAKRERAPSLLGQLALEEINAALNGVILLHHILDRLHGMNNGAVIATTKSLANFLERVAGELPREVHRDLPRKGNGAGPALAGHIGVTDLIMIGDAFLDPLDIETILGFLHQDVFEQQFG